MLKNPHFQTSQHRRKSQNNLYFCFKSTALRPNTIGGGKVVNVADAEERDIHFKVLKNFYKCEKNP